MRKDLSYYMKLPYIVVVRPLTKSEGEGYFAYMPELGSYAFCADGDTPEEALKALEVVKTDLFRGQLQHGTIKIPKPGEAALIFVNEDGFFEVEKLNEYEIGEYVKVNTFINLEHTYMVKDITHHHNEKLECSCEKYACHFAVEYHLQDIDDSDVAELHICKRDMKRMPDGK